LIYPTFVLADCEILPTIRPLPPPAVNLHRDFLVEREVMNITAFAQVMPLLSSGQIDCSPEVAQN
jgi:hypothetical protein